MQEKERKMKVVKQIDVYLVSKKNTRPIDVVQYDTGIQLEFTVKDFELPDGTTATLYVQKPSGKFVYQEDGITISDNTITVALENQAIAEHGKVLYQVSLTNGSDDITTFEGVMMVQRSLKDSGSTESRTVIRAFDNVVQDRLNEFQTRAEAAAQAVIATIPEDYTAMEAKVNQLANAIKGNLSGEVVAADDVSPVEHVMGVKVHGKNLLPYGTITLTKNQNCKLDSPLPAGTYTISAYITSNDTDGVLSAVSINGGSEVLKYITLKRDERVSATFTVSKPITNIDFCAAYNYALGEGDSATWSNIQLEEGTTATEYTPYIDPTTVTVRRCGKNLIPFPYVDGDVGNEYTNAGITYTVNADKSITANGTATTNSYFRLCNVYFGESYIYENKTTGEFACSDCQYDDGNSFTFIMIMKGTTVANKVYHPQVESGTKNTEWESPKERVDYIPSSDGTVSGMTSLSPNMTILTDTEGAIVECEYNKDTNKVIQKIAAALDISI